MVVQLVVLLSWRRYALRAALALAIGAVALCRPGPLLLVLVGCCAAYGLVAGLMALAAASAFEAGPRRWLMQLLGLATLATGALGALHPGWAALGLVLLIGFNALFCGLIELPQALRERTLPDGPWALLRSGAAIVFGALLLAWPGAALLLMVWTVGLYAALIGALYLALAVRVLRHGAGPGPEPGPAAP